MSARDFPADEVLIARGQYSTIGAERRSALKGLQDDMTALANKASVILRIASMRPLDVDALREELERVGARVGSASGYIHSITALSRDLDSIRPLAWGGKDNEE